jgi:ribosome-binding factor A
MKRQDRLNSLLKEVISEVIQKDIDDPKISTLLTVTKVDISKDLKNAKIYISVIGNDKEKENTISTLQKNAATIYKIASKKVTLKYFPSLKFILDNSLEKLLKIEKILKDIKK